MTQLLQQELYCWLFWNGVAPGVFTARTMRQWLGVSTVNETWVADTEEAAEPEAAVELEANAMAIEEDIENEGMATIEALAAETEAAAEPELENARQSKRRCE